MTRLVEGKRVRSYKVEVYGFYRLDVVHILVEVVNIPNRLEGMLAPAYRQTRRTCSKYHRIDRNVIIHNLMSSLA